MSALATTTEKTFANVVKETNIHDSQKSLKEIIKDARTEEFKDDRDKNRDEPISSSMALPIKTFLTK